MSALPFAILFSSSSFVFVFPLFFSSFLPLDVKSYSLKCNHRRMSSDMRAQCSRTQAASAKGKGRREWETSAGQHACAPCATGRTACDDDEMRHGAAGEEREERDQNSLSLSHPFFPPFVIMNIHTSLSVCRSSLTASLPA